MSVVRMAGVSIIGLPEGIEKLARKFLSEGFFEPMPLEVMLEGEPPKSRVRLFKENPYDFAVLDKVKLLWKMAGEKLPPETGERSAKMSVKEAAEFAEEIAAKIAEWEAWGERLKDDCAGIEALILISEALADSGYTVHDLNNSQNIAYSVGAVLVENWDRLSELSTASPLIVRELLRRSDHVLALVLYPREYKNDANKLFDAVNFNEYPGGSFSEEFESIEAMKERLSSLQTELKDHSRVAARFIANNRDRCERAYNGIRAMRRVYSLMNYRGEVAGMIAISGFIPEEKLQYVRRLVAREAPEAVFITEMSENIARHALVPTLLKNNPFVRIFHNIVTLYSVPAYDEYDPSPIVAFSFCLFFGMMFGDVGHGIILTLAAWLLEKKGIMSKAFSGVIKVAGIISIIFGRLYGSVFGEENIIDSIWLSPMHDTNNLIATSIIIGVVFLSLGIFLRLRIMYQKSEWGEFFFSGEGLAGILFYWTAIGTLVYGISGFPSPVVKWLLVFLLVALFTVIAGGNYLTKKIFKHKPENEGVVHVFSVAHAMLSFISNTASFVRLAAFAMNHAGLSLATYMLADMVRAAPLGRVSSLLIVIVGNVLIVGLEGLIVFIQTLRLEYYEFFSKFFRGGGRSFAPISWKD